ncbi:unnamed protein product [Paramecium octaurelia]|uniref:Uncharacterized protein n=1 Tax=Paramecium octaurelia TaxID=43137 RepID=A0A8S1W9A7_PAROT|nr:unnamed protein product [Paramecium octaurelia]
MPSSILPSFQNKQGSKSTIYFEANRDIRNGCYRRWQYQRTQKNQEITSKLRLIKQIDIIFRQFEYQGQEHLRKLYNEYGNS